MTLTLPRADVRIANDGGQLTREWLRSLEEMVRQQNSGVTVTVPLAKLTGGGANGSLTFVNGLLTAATAPT